MQREVKGTQVVSVIRSQKYFFDTIITLQI
jgi:hypothetical protein